MKRIFPVVVLVLFLSACIHRNTDKRNDIRVDALLAFIGSMIDVSCADGTHIDPGVCESWKESYANMLEANKGTPR